MTSDRVRLVAVVQRLINGDYESEAVVDYDVAEFVAAVPRPRATDLIYYWDREFDHEPSAEGVVDRALSYAR